jgi:hypothetical protein
MGMHRKMKASWFVTFPFSLLGRLTPPSDLAALAQCLEALDSHIYGSPFLFCKSIDLSLYAALVLIRVFHKSISLLRSEGLTAPPNLGGGRKAAMLVYSNRRKQGCCASSATTTSTFRVSCYFAQERLRASATTITHRVEPTDLNTVGTHRVGLAIPEQSHRRG